MRNSILILSIVYLIVILPGTKSVVAQTSLKPSIGLWAIPDDGDSVCDIPLAIDPDNLFDTAGLQDGDTVPDFKLYTVSNDSMHLADVITDGKPVLLVGGSYTCPKYRNHLDELSDLQSTYGSQVNIYVVYTVEAHPDSPDISPYKGEVWQLNSNDQDDIHYHEPVTYLDRKNAASDMLNILDVPVSVLLDGPCNTWWQTYALAPNPAFLISPKGTIFKKQAWFDNGLYGMSAAIDDLLQQLSTGIQDVSFQCSIVNDPSLSVVQFNFSESLEHGSVMLFDAMGRTVKSANDFSGNMFTLEKQGLSSGVYFYSIHADGRVLNGKILVQ